MPCSDVRRFLPLTHLEYHLLAALVDDATHGYALVQRIRERSNGLINPGTGSFYSIVKKLCDSGLIAEASAESSDQRRRCYAVTTLGRVVLVAETDRLSAQIAATRRLRPAPSSRGGRG
jgi:DNA-binding PadR family transcriptional regulator